MWLFSVHNNLSHFPLSEYEEVKLAVFKIIVVCVELNDFIQAVVSKMLNLQT